MFCTSCDNLDGDVDKVNYDHWAFDHRVFFSFQDSSGNDLVKGLEYDWWRSDLYPDEPEQVVVNSDLYTLDISFSDPYMDPGYYPYCPKFIDGLALGIRYEVMHMPEMIIRKVDGYQYISFAAVRSGNYDGIDIPREIIFKLTCPHIFGDDNPREIITTWIDTRHTIYSGELFCEYVEFDGKKYITDKSAKFGWSGENVGVKTFIIK